MLNGFKPTEVTSKLTALAMQYLEKKNYLFYYLYARQAYIYNRDKHDIETLYNYIVASYYLKDYEKVITLSVEWLQSSYKARAEQVADVYYIKAKSYYEMKMIHSADDNFKIALSEYIKLKNNERLSEIDKIMRDRIERRRASKSGKTDIEKKEECSRGSELLKNDQIKLNSAAYVLPLDWLQKWQEYIGFAGSESREEMELEKEKVNRLGPIMQDTLMDENFFLLDPDEEEYYCNVQVRSTAIEGVDFILVSEETWNFFYEKYGGVPIPRFSYQGHIHNTPKVEVFLQKLNILLFPLPKKDQPSHIGIKDVVYISKSKTLAHLTKKLVRIYDKIFPGTNVPLYEKRLWKVEHQFSMNESWKNWNNKIPFEISAFVLNEDFVIEDAEVSDQDTLVLEFRILRDFWLLESDDVTNKLNRRKLRREKSLKTLDLSDYPEDARKGVVGLQNLGNTCFMNSALQCLSNCYPLTSYFLTDEYEKDVNVHNVLGTGGKLAVAYADLVKELWLGNNSYFSPYEMKRVIGKFAGQFIGYSQQDSQEFLSYLLDGMHEDMNRVIKTEKKATTSQERESDLLSSEEAWRTHLKQNQSRIQELFHGQFKSTIVCPDCHLESKSFEPFMILSAPIPNEQFVKFTCYYVPVKGTPSKIEFNIMGNTTVRELKNKIADIGKTNPNYIVVGLVKTHNLQSFVRDDVEAFQLANAPEIAFSYELPEIDPEYHTVDESIFICKVYMYVPVRDQIFPVVKAFTRLITVEPSDNFRDIKLKIYKRMRSNLKDYYKCQGNDRKMDLDNDTKDQIEKEYKYYFNEDQEDMWPYILQVYIQYSNDRIRMDRLDESMNVKEFLKENHYNWPQLSFNLIVARHVNEKNLNLNVCLPVTAGEDKSLDIRRAYNIYDCLTLFTRDERLSIENAWACTKCKANKQATKKLAIFKAPEMLIIHLKRFKNVKYSSFGAGLYSKKLTSFVDFPLQELDIKNYVISNTENTSTVYDLYGITNHYGELNGGHYTAHAKNALDNTWYTFNDSNVQPAIENELVTNAAYMLFYQRRK